MEESCFQVRGAEQGTAYIQGKKVKKVDHFKYLGTVVSVDGSCEEEVKRRVQAGWQGWRRALGVVCDRKLSARLKREDLQECCRAGNVASYGDSSGDRRDG